MRAARIKVVGIVQGVGFRPFVYRLAVCHGLKGYVRNLGGAEVEIHVEGDEAAISAFIRALREEAPPTAMIEELTVEEAEPLGLGEFRIVKSEKAPSRLSMIPPDFSICDHCLREMLDPSSRFYRYPFHSCAWCGPRFSMIEAIPYDRENTAMRDFPLCEECLAEYNDPENVRRFHAQGISCPRCGPRLFLADADGNLIECRDPIAEAARLIDEGHLVAVKGVGGFHIAALATDDDVVAELRRRKRRPTKPFALMARDLEVASRLVELTPEARELLLSPIRPIVVLPRREDAPVSSLVAPGLRTLGVMLAYTGLHYLLLSSVRDGFLIMTSGNPHGMPICKDEREAFRLLRGIVDYFLYHNRRIVNRVDDSVVRLTDGRPTLLRRSRGYAPRWLRLPFRLRAPIVALGAELKNAGAIALDRYVIPTQYVGDTDTIECLNFLEEALRFLMRCYRVSLGDALIAADMHPSYMSRRLAERWAREHGSRLILVQHHHAHLVSLMVELRIPIREHLVGIAIDGLGYGLDGRLWGCEVLVVGYERFARRAHLRYMPMIGGDLATRYPARMLIGALSLVMDPDELRALCAKLGLQRALPHGERELDVIFKLLEAREHPLTSSLGRLLDAASALLGVCYERTYEGEPAIRLEEFARAGRILSDLFEPRVTERDGASVIDGADLLLQLVEALGEHRPEDLAATFQYVLGRTLGELAARYAKEATREEVLVSGGAAVNDFIIRGMREALSEAGLRLVTHRELPPGDGGICVGQVGVAAAQAEAWEA